MRYLIAALLLLVTACSSEPKLEGTWLNPTTRLTWEFVNDSTYFVRFADENLIEEYRFEYDPERHWFDAREVGRLGTNHTLLTIQGDTMYHTVRYEDGQRPLRHIDPNTTYSELNGVITMVYVRQK